MKMVTAVTADERKEPHGSCPSELGDTHSWSLIWCQVQPQVGDPRPSSFNTSRRTRPHILPCLPFPVSGASEEGEETPAKTNKQTGKENLLPGSAGTQEQPWVMALCPVWAGTWSCLVVKTQQPLSSGMIVDFFIILRLDF